MGEAGRRLTDKRAATTDSNRTENDPKLMF